MNGAKATPMELKAHGIQLEFLGVKEIHFDSDRMPGVIKVEDLEDQVFGSGHSSYDKTNKAIAVLVSWEVKTKDGGVTFRISLNAVFRVNEQAFPAERVEEWAEKGSFYVLFPYLREHIYSMCLRTGFPMIRLPMVEIPTFKIAKPTPEADQQLPLEPKQENLVQTH
jgi:preprotein translocase subunit SecB